MARYGHAQKRALKPTVFPRDVGTHEFAQNLSGRFALQAARADEFLPQLFFYANAQTRIFHPRTLADGYTDVHPIHCNYYQALIIH